MHVCSSIRLSTTPYVCIYTPLGLSISRSLYLLVSVSHPLYAHMCMHICIHVYVDACTSHTALQHMPHMHDTSVYARTHARTHA